MKKSLLAGIAMTVISLNAFADAITEQQILDAQDQWAQGIVDISNAKISGEDYRIVAREVLENLYGYEEGAVLFKPTKAKENQFRETSEQAESYFVAGQFKEDKGFAINPWTKVRFENHGIIIEDDIALAMGNYYFTDLEGEEAKVEYTFGYKLDDDDNVKIVLHHSSVPYNP